MNSTGKHIYNTYNKQQHMCGNKIRKNPLLGVVPFVQGCELFPPYQSHVEY
jgi:hypothetical protein